jgi:glycosyltransferase involved in cell wall biosynthesis
MTSPRALYLASEYRVQEVREKMHEQYFEARHASGYFSRVWAVHPLADLVGAKKGRIGVIRFSRRQIVIEGVSEFLRLPRAFLPLNFLISQILLLRLLVRVIRKNSISVIIATDPFWSGLLGVALKKLTRRPLVVRIGANYDELYEASGELAMPRLIPFYRAQQAICRLALRNADLVSGNNRNNLAWARANGARKHLAILPISGNVQKIHLVPPEVRSPCSEVFRRHGIPVGVPTLLTLGRLVRLKHPDHALRAMARVFQEERNAIGIFAGGGGMLPELKNLARSLGIAERVYFLGQTNQRDLSEIIPHCITLSPVTGLALIECGLGGSPIVAYDRDWQAEFIESGVSGFIVPQADWEAMADRVLRIIRDPKLASAFSQKIRARALKQVDLQEVRRLEKEAFDKVLAPTY